MSNHFKSAEEVKDKSGRQYHLSVAPGEINKYILLCGDPKRAEKTSKFFDNISVERRHREYVTISGEYNNIPMTVVATGIGTDNTEIAIVELSQCQETPVFLRIGTCGTLQPDIELGDIVISSAALKMENTTSWFVPPEYPAIADYRLVSIAKEIASKNDISHHVGLTATCSGFYGAQERTSGKFKPLITGRLDKLSELNVLNFEMEASTLFVLSSIIKAPAAAICTVYANRPKNIFIDPTSANIAEEKLIKLGLDIMTSIKNRSIL